MKTRFSASKFVVVAALIVIQMAIAGAAIALTQPAAPKQRQTINKAITNQLPLQGLNRVSVGSRSLLDDALSGSALRLPAKSSGKTVLAAQPAQARKTSAAGGKVTASRKYKTTRSTKSYRRSRYYRKTSAASATQVAAQPQQLKAPLLTLNPNVAPELEVTPEPKAVPVAAPAATEQPVLPPLDVTLEPGQSYVIKGRGISRTAVSSPEIVDIVPVSATELLVNAKKEGVTTVRVWDATGQSSCNFTVARKQASSAEVASEITRQIGISTITAEVVGETIVLSGTAPSADIAHKVGLVAEATGRKCINLARVESVSAETVVASLKAVLPSDCLAYEVLADHTIMMKGTVATVEDARRIEQVIQTWVGTPEQVSDSNAATSTRINFIGKEQDTPPEAVDKARTIARTNDDGDVIVATEMNFNRRVFGGRIPNGPRIVAMLDINPALAKQVLVSAKVLEVDRTKLKTLGIQWDELLGSNPTNPLVILEDRVTPIALNDGGPFRRTDITASIKALITEDAARILSEPKLLITDGHAANILVGGEIPIPVAQSNTLGSASITVEFKPFGIQLTVRPKVTTDGRILISVTPEVSSLDFTNAVRIADFEIPALRTRRATTTVHMASGESLAIGGLLSSDDLKSIDRVPLLSKIPIIGELFKSRRFEKQETELIIIVTPQVIERGAPVPIAPPADGGQ